VLWHEFGDICTVVHEPLLRQFCCPASWHCNRMGVLLCIAWFPVTIHVGNAHYWLYFLTNWWGFCYCVSADSLLPGASERISFPLFSCARCRGNWQWHHRDAILLPQNKKLILKSHQENTCLCWEANGFVNFPRFLKRFCWVNAVFPEANVVLNQVFSYLNDYACIQ
jgi:hypothetical protein